MLHISPLLVSREGREKGERREREGREKGERGGGIREGKEGTDARQRESGDRARTRQRILWTTAEDPGCARCTREGELGASSIPRSLDILGELW